MSDENVKVGGLGATLTAVNGISKSSVWILGDDIGAPGRVYPDNPQGISKLGCVKAGTNITIDPDGTISATGTLGTAWTNITGKPFDTIGSGLTVTGGVLSVTGGGGSVDWKDILNKPATFPATPATATTLGGVKAGANITITSDGTISASGSPGGSVDWKDVLNKPSTFTPPIATAVIVGGVKQGTNITIAADGTISATGGTIVPATKTILGGIKVGAGLNVAGDGTLSTQDVAPNWSDIQGKPATFTPPIASETVLGGVKEGAGINIQPDGTISTVSAAPTWEEIENKPATFNPPIANKDVLGGVKQGAGVTIAPDGAISTNIQSIDWDIIVDKPEAYPPTIAEEGKVGGVKPGNNISIEADGTINAAAVDLPIASVYTLGGVKIGSGITIAEDGTIGTNSSAPYWLDIVDKPRAYPPTVAKDSMVGGIMPDSTFSVNDSGVLSAKPFTGKSFQLTQYDDDGKISSSATAQNRNGNLILGGVTTSKETGEEVSFGGQLTLLDVTGAYQASIRNDSFDYNILLSNGPNIKAGFLPFITMVENADISLSFGPAKDAIGYATKTKIGLAQVGNNIDVDNAGVLSVKTATTEARGLVQVGSGLEVDVNGVISTTNVIAFVNQFQDVNTDLKLSKQGKWTVPEGVDYFRVTLIGPGGKGGQSGGDAEKYAGGGGGGGGAMYQFMVNAYAFENKTFTYVLGAQVGVHPTFTGTCNFFDGNGTQLCVVGGGQNGEDGDAKNPSEWGFAKGGRGGSIAQALPDDERFGPRYYASGTDGSAGFRIVQIVDSSKHKAIGGVGGTSGGGSGLDGVGSQRNGYGAGAAGGGDNYPYGISNAGFSYIRIEW